MNRVRRGKDFKVLWSFFDYNGEPYQLDKTFLTLYVSNSFDRFEVTDFSVEENTITWIFRGKDQKALGDYTLELIQNNGTEGMIPIDSVDAFTLVQYSRDESLCGGGNVKIEDVTVNSTLDIETISSLIDAQLSEISVNPVQNKVITAALNNKADKSSVPTKTSQLTNDSGFITAEEAPAPDWNASIYKEGHIKNRTHHMQDYMCQYFKGSPIKISKPSDVGYVLLAYDTDLPEKFIRIEINANESKTYEFLDAMGMPIIFTWDAGNSTINVQSFGGAIDTYGMRAYYSSSAKGYDNYFVALDEGFIPEEVARKSELKTINGESILGEGDIEIKGGSSTFVTDFTVNDLYELVYRGAHPVQANIVALQRALENKERIVVPYGTEDLNGYSLLQGYYEDLVYFTVADENGSTYVVEVGQYAGEIERDNVTHVSPKENKINIADLQNGKVNKTDVATINGKSIINGGNITIEGGEGSLDSEVVSSTEASEEFPQVLYVEQTLTEAQKSQARKNIGADNTELKEQITELSAEVSEVSVVVNGKPQETLEWQAEGYYAINSSVSEGAVVNINVQPQALYRCLMVECAEGDSFLYTGRNGAFRPYAFLDSAYRLLPNYGVFGTKYKDEKITAPQGSAYVVMQTLNAEWVELGSLPLQRLGSKGIAEEAEKVKDAILVTPNIRAAQESMQVFSNLNVESKTLNNVFSYGDFKDSSVWTARPNTSLIFSNGIARMQISGTTAVVGISTSKASQIVVPSKGKAFLAIRMRINQDNVLFKVSINGTTYQELRSNQAVSKNTDWEWSIIEWNPTNAYTASYLVLEAEKQGANMTSDALVEVKDFIVGIYADGDNMTYDNFVALLQSQEWFYGSVVIPNAERFIALDSQIRRDIVVSVGEGGDFQSLNAAMAYLSQFYPMYKYGGIKAEIRILNGTTITDQVLVVGADYSWMTITYEGYNPDGLTYDNVAESIANGTIVFGQTGGYNAVAVDASSWGSSGITHDTRGDVCLFRAEDGGRLPKIKCVFKLTNKGEYDVAGICCNRGSSCVVATLCGFIGFNDGVIANNESSITIREGITMNCGRWGCHARHNGEVSARSVIAVGCATDAKYSGESAALCADRIADLDGREAWVSCGNAFAVRNTSRMNCNGTHVLGSADETAIIYATAVGVGNFTSLYIDAGVKIDHSQGAMLSVSEYTFRESYVFNDVTNKGIIYK